MGEGCQGVIEVFTDLDVGASISVPQGRSSDIWRLDVFCRTRLLFAILYLEQCEYVVDRVQLVTYL
jgi:hypothetical protein